MSLYDIVSARAEIATLATSTGQVKRAAGTNDGGGAKTFVWSNHGSSFACNLQNMPGDEMIQGLALMNRTFYKVFVPVGTDVTPEDRVNVDGLDYEIHDVGLRSNALSVRLIVSKLS